MGGDCVDSRSAALVLRHNGSVNDAPESATVVLDSEPLKPETVPDGPRQSSAATADLVAHGVRYGLAGACVAVVYVGLTLLLSGPLGVPIQAAILVALVVAVVVHFCFQRFFVFRGAPFALSVRDQAGRYLVITAVQYALTAATTTFLPGLLGVSEQVVYLGTVITISTTGFVVLRTHVFHAHRR
jgi:putative flippase GtrA